MTFYHGDRASVRELAELWKPGVPVANNPEYVARARQLNKALETALVQHLNPGRDTDGGQAPVPEPASGSGLEDGTPKKGTSYQVKWREP